MPNVPESQIISFCLRSAQLFRKPNGHKIMDNGNMSHLHYLRVCRKGMTIWLKGDCVSAIFSLCRSVVIMFVFHLKLNYREGSDNISSFTNSTYARKQKAIGAMIQYPIFIQEFAGRHQLFIENSKFYSYAAIHS